jgi:hypothetical protein
MRDQAARGKRQAEKVGVSRGRRGLEVVPNHLETAKPLVSIVYSSFRRREQNGQKSRFAGPAKSTGLPEHLDPRHTRPAIKNRRLRALNKKREHQANTGADDVTSISYLPATFTTLFFLAAALLLGLSQ